jgi:hypothetical protein
MKIKGIPIWLALVAILGISGAVYYLTGLGQALGALAILTLLYFFPLDNGVAAGNAEAAKTDAYREQWLGRRKAWNQDKSLNDPVGQVPGRESANGHN